MLELANPRKNHILEYQRASVEVELLELLIQRIDLVRPNLAFSEHFHDGTYFHLTMIMLISKDFQSITMIPMLSSR